AALTTAADLESRVDRRNDNPVWDRSGGLVVRLGGGSGRLGRARTAGQGEFLAFIERANAHLVEAGLVDLKVSAVQRIRRQFLDRKTNSFSRSAKSPVGEARPLFLAD